MKLRLTVLAVLGYHALANSRLEEANILQGTASDASSGSSNFSIETPLRPCAEDKTGEIEIRSVKRINEKKDCAWARKNFAKKLRCSIPEILEHCPKTCRKEQDPCKSDRKSPSRKLETSYSCPLVTSDPSAIPGNFLLLLVFSLSQELMFCFMPVIFLSQTHLPYFFLYPYHDHRF